MERDARCALLYQYQQFQIAVGEYHGEYQRQSREAVNKAGKGSSENSEMVMMMQQRHGIQNRREGASGRK